MKPNVSRALALYDKSKRLYEKAAQNEKELNALVASLSEDEFNDYQLQRIITGEG